MDPTKEHESPATSSPDDVDFISGLHDDLLLRILSFLPTSSEVARTTVLSKRWQHLWRNAIALRYTVGSEPIKSYYYTQADRDHACRLIASANAVLTRRACAGPDVEDLELSFIYSSRDNIYVGTEYSGYHYKHYHAADISSEHVAAWISFAARHVTRKFTLEVPVVPKRFRFADAVAALMALAAEEAEDQVEEEEEEDQVEEEEGEGEGDEEADLTVEVAEQLPSEAVEEESPVTEDEEDDEDYPLPPEYEYEDESESQRSVIAELPCSARVKEMSLTLGKATLMVPAAGAGAFHALTDILLSHIVLGAGSGDGFRLCHLLSSSCSPVLRRVQLNYIDGLSELHLNAAGTLQDLRILHICYLHSLDVEAPGLRVLGVKECCGLNSVRISAPRLEVLACQETGCVERLRFDGATSLRRIEDLQLSTHWLHPCNEEEKDDDYNSAAMWFLRHCDNVEWLSLELMSAPEMCGEEVHYEDNIEQIPKLPKISNLKIKFGCEWSQGHAIGATAAKLIAKRSEIEDLSIETFYLVNVENCLDPNCICNGAKGWENQKLSLEHLRNIDFCNFLPLESQIQLIQLLLISAPAVEKMTLALQTLLFEGSVAVDFRIPCCGGRWIPCDWKNNFELGITWATKYEWSRVNDGSEVQRADLDGICVCLP